jgi:hypothetical protein
MRKRCPAPFISGHRLKFETPSLRHVQPANDLTSMLRDANIEGGIHLGFV